MTKHCKIDQAAQRRSEIIRARVTKTEKANFQESLKALETTESEVLRSAMQKTINKYVKQKGKQ